MTRNELTKLWAKVTGKFDALIAGAPEALDTLKEIADKLGDDDDALAGLLSAVAGKQDTLTFDSAPTYGSSNPVTSDGVKSYVDTMCGDIETLLSNI